MKSSLIVLSMLMAAANSSHVLAQNSPKTDPSKDKAEKAEKVDPIDTDRGNFTNGAGIVPKGSMQIETGTTLTRLGNMQQLTIGEALLRIPVTDKTEVRLGLNSYAVVLGGGSISTGYQDFNLGYKVKLREQKGTGGWGAPAMAINVSATFPSGSSAYREKVIQPMGLLILSRDVTEKFSVGVNIGYGSLSSGGQHFSQWIASTSGQFKLSAKTTAFVEYIGVLPGGPSGPNANYIDTGILYLLTDALQLDARIGKGFSGSSRDDFIGGGISYRWK